MTNKGARIRPVNQRLISELFVLSINANLQFLKLIVQFE
jgi:hypothetical protein